MGWLSNVTGVFTGSNGRAAGNAAYDSLQSSQNKATGYLDPYNKAGQLALPNLTGLLTGQQIDPATGKSTTLNEDQRGDLFKQNPGFQFSLDQALKGIQAGQAAKGNLLSGGGQKEIANYATGAASQSYDSYINQLFQLAGGGADAAAQQANVVTGLAAPMANARYASGIANQVAGKDTIGLITSFAGAAAGSGGSGGYNSPNSSGSSLGSFGGAANIGSASTASTGGSGLQAATLAASDRDLKENISLIGKSESGIPIYHFDYKDKNHGQFRYEGVMAQDLEEIKPETVIEKNGYKMVNYSLIDVEFKRVN